MVRTRIIALFVLATVRVAMADDAASTPTTVAYETATSAPAAAASTPVTAPSAGGNKREAKKQTAGTKGADGKAEPPVAANEAVPPGGDVKMSGMSILGNEDAPKSLVIVPWKSSQLADMPSVSRLLDSATQPVDKDVFMRELSYYEFKAGSK
jgi:hypothetical protein